MRFVMGFLELVEGILENFIIFSFLFNLNFIFIVDNMCGYKVPGGRVVVPKF